MNRLQRKCFIASAGIHLLLALILIIGPGFISSKSKQDDVPILDFVPIKTVDDLMSGGGNPKAKPPPAAAPAQAQPPPQPEPQPVSAPPPQPEPQPKPVRETEPPKPIDPSKADADSLESTKQTKRKIEISRTLVTRKHESGEEKRAKEEARAQAEAKAAADARRRLARQLGRVADRIGNDVSGSTSVEDVKDFKGPGGGGLPYGNWRAAIKTIYEDAWLLPEGVVDDDATTVASVTIAKDGTVISSEITHFSGDGVVDRSVQAALDRVRHTPPLPDTVSDSQRTVVIKFSVKAKRGLG